MTAAYGTIGYIGYASRTNMAVPAPAGVANGNFLLMCCSTINGSGTAPAMTLPAGWTQLGTDMTLSDSGGAGIRGTIAWKIASGEPANYTITHTTSSCSALVMRITGSATLSLDGSPNFSQAVSPGTGSGTTSATAVSPATTSALLVFISMNWEEYDLTPPTGMTERQNGFLYVATQALSASGSTGARTIAHGSMPWFANLIAVTDAAVAGGGGKPVKVWSGSAWVTKPVKVWNGSAWVTKPAKVWNGSAWV